MDMEQRLPWINTLQTYTFFDASAKIKNPIFSSEILERERLCQDFEVSENPGRLAIAEGRLNTLFFDSAAFPRPAHIAGPSINSKAVAANSDPDFGDHARTLDADNALLHGLKLLKIRNYADNIDYQACFMVENTDDESVLYFPFGKTEHLSFLDEQSFHIQTILQTADSMVDSVNKTRLHPTFANSNPSGQHLLLMADEERNNYLLGDIIRAQRPLSIEADFYFFKKYGDTEGDIRINNNTLGGIYEPSQPAEISGTFIGLTTPLVMQPNLLDDNQLPTTTIDPFEPCLMFHSEAMDCRYTVPYSKLRHVV